MPDPQQETGMPVAGRVDLGPGKFADGSAGVMLTLTPQSMTTDRNGEPTPGVCLETWQARRIAYLLLTLAEEMDAKTRLGLTT